MQPDGFHLDRALWNEATQVASELGLSVSDFLIQVFEEETQRLRKLAKSGQPVTMPFDGNDPNAVAEFAIKGALARHRRPS